MYIFQEEKWNKPMGGRSCFITSGAFGDTLLLCIYDALSPILTGKIFFIKKNIYNWSFAYFVIKFHISMPFSMTEKIQNKLCESLNKTF